MNYAPDSLDSVRGIHAGRTAYVCGSGPSIDGFVPPPDGIVFACNQSITALPRADYFCMTDGAIPEANFFDWGVARATKTIFMSGYSFLEKKEILDRWDYLLPRSWFFDRRYNEQTKSYNFDSAEDPHRLIEGTDVIHPTAHLAWAMGCSPIVLVGVDLLYTNGRKYCNPTEFGKPVEWSYPELRPAMWFESKLPDGHDDIHLMTSLDCWTKIKAANPGVAFRVNGQGRLRSLFDSAIQLTPD